MFYIFSNIRHHCVINMLLITHQFFSCCQAVLTQHQGLLCFSLCPHSMWNRDGQEAGRGRSWDSWTELTTKDIPYCMTYSVIKPECSLCEVAISQRVSGHWSHLSSFPFFFSFFFSFLFFFLSLPSPLSLIKVALFWTREFFSTFAILVILVLSPMALRVDWVNDCAGAWLLARVNPPHLLSGLDYVAKHSINGECKAVSLTGHTPRN